MKLLLGFLVSLSFLACNQNNQTKKGERINIYIAGCDSIFFCKNSFSPETLSGSKKDDSAFIYGIIKDNASKPFLLKTFAGSCGGMAETTVDLATVLKRNNIDFTVARPDSIETKYFNDVSFIDFMKQRESEITLNIPKEETAVDSVQLIFLMDKKDHLYYSHSPRNKERFVIVTPFTTQRIVDVI